MADYYASIFGTEKDKVNCSFYFKIGACRHGDRCSRVHNRPAYSQTVLIQNLYVNPTNQARSEGREITEEEDQRHFDEFYEDIFVELEDKYGPIEEMNVCDNLGDHLIGNVYVKFTYEEDAPKAVSLLNERWFGGKPVYAELSTVSDFREAGCRQYEVDACTRGGFCNFMHIKQISDDLRRYLFGSSRSGGGRDSSRQRSRRTRRSSRTAHDSRSRSPLSISPRPRSRSRSRSGSIARHRSPSYTRRKSSSRRNRSRRQRNRHSRRPTSRSRSRSPGLEDDDVEGPPLPPPRESRSRSPVRGARSPRSRSASPA